MKRSTSKMNDKKIVVRKLYKCSEEIAKKIDIDKVILFGSYAKGGVTKESDIDVLVIGSKKDRDLRTKMGLMFHKTLPKKPIDVLLKTRDEIERRLKIGDSFIKEIIDKGEVIYERDYGGVVG